MRYPDGSDPFDGHDATFTLDGGVCKSRFLIDGKSFRCGGTIVAEPVPANDPARLRCRDCGART